MTPEVIQILIWVIERHNRVNQHVHDGAIEDLPGFATHSSDEKEIRNTRKARKTEGDGKIIRTKTRS